MNRTALRAAKASLTSAGWTEVCSVMSDSGKQTGHYGILFTRDGAEFYLNVETVGALPA